MDVRTNIPLKNFTTMKIGGPARFMTEVRTPQEVIDIYTSAAKQSLPIFILGGGSNVIARDEGYNGIVVRIRIPGFEILTDDTNSTTIKVGAGEIWDSVVQKTVEMRLSGIEAMSAIPGTAGAAPVQNIGAYGQELADTMQSLEAYDTRMGQIVVLQNSDCDFKYRDSIFRSTEKGRFVILSITLKLSKNLPQPPFYDTLQKYLDDRGINIFTHEVIRNSVIDIRKEKLPDPTVLPNSGSFFKNALVESWQLKRVKEKFPDIPSYEMADGSFKIPTGWMIEHAGLKGELIEGIRVYQNNALVLVNESAESYENLANARNAIIGKIRDTFGIQIEQEPLEIF